VKTPVARMERSDIRGWGTSWPGFRCAQSGLRLLYLEHLNHFRQLQM